MVKNTRIVMEKIEKLNNFQNKIKEIYGEKVGTDIIKEIVKKSLTSFRVNTIKAKSEEVLSELKKLGYVIEEREVPGSYFVINSLDTLALSRSKFFDEGKIYIQNLSSMIPALVLAPSLDDNILDLCAAPGSKTTQLAALSDNSAKITAVENNINRFNLLKRVVENQDAKNINFIRASSQNLPCLYPQYINYFDKVLCDVPCSNEGLIREPDTHDFKYWNPKLPKKLSNLQKKILASGIRMLKPKGILVYSTCTYSVEENEQVINWALKKFPEMKMEKLEINYANKINGLTTWRGKKFQDDIRETLRIIPNEHFEAFFIAKLVKS